MNREASILVEKYNSGILSPEEEQQLELFIEQGIIEIEQLNDLNELGDQLGILFSETLSREMRQDFYQLLEEEKVTQKQPLAKLYNHLQRYFQSEFSFRYIASACFVLLGLWAGIFIASSQKGDEPALAQLSNDLQDMREMMMLSLLENQSSSERLKAVHLASEMTEVNDKIASALLKTLNQDPNTNVRLSALNALVPYADDPKVRSGLIASISRQESPLVQMTMAEIMVALQEEKAIDALQELLEKDITPKEVKDKLNYSISKLL